MQKTIRSLDHLNIVMTDVSNPADRNLIDQKVKNFNHMVCDQYGEISQPGHARPLDITVRDNIGRLAGGLIASTYWSWLAIDECWLDESLRGQGYGRDLLEAAEAEAIERGCRYASSKTYSFQAREFFEKQGYRVIGQLDDYPPGQTLYWLRKELTSPADSLEANEPARAVDLG